MAREGSLNPEAPKSEAGLKGSAPPSYNVRQNKVSAGRNVAATPALINKGAKPGSGTPANHPAAQSVAKVYSERMSASDNRAKGVGGDVKFWIGIAKRGPDGLPIVDQEYPKMEFELAPARTSWFDRQGQRVPGAGAGLNMRLKSNIAKLVAPGSKPIIQHMGVAEEVLEWAGAFVGFDHWEERTEDGRSRYDKEGNPVVAAYEANRLVEQFKRQREVILHLSWDSSRHNFEFNRVIKDDRSVGIQFTGYIRDIRRIDAHANRVYYAISLAVTNREDIAIGLVQDTSTPFTPPLELQDIGALTTPWSATAATQAVNEASKKLAETDPEKVERPSQDLNAVEHAEMMALAKALTTRQIGRVGTNAGPGEQLSFNTFYSDLQKVNDYYAAHYDDYQKVHEFKAWRSIAINRFEAAKPPGDKYPLNLGR